MNVAEFNTMLLETTLASMAAILLVLLLRRPLRVRFGATVAYGAWLLVPVTMLAVLLPAAAETVPVVMQPAAVGAAFVGIASAPVFDPAPWLLAAWALGALAMAAWLLAQQHRFERALGSLQIRADGLRQAATNQGLPAALGLLRPRIVVPADFEARYDVEQRALMQAHERTHIRRGDLHVNALVATLRCLFWFNPLLHFAARRFRHDQELACDQRVIALHPNSRRAYGEAMFRIQLASQPLPLGCHWGYGHPLRERIQMLKQPAPSTGRWLAGSALVVGLGLLAGAAAWAAQPKRQVPVLSTASAEAIRADLQVRIADGQPRRFTLVNKANKAFMVSMDEDGHQWTMVATATPRDDGTLDLRTRLSRDGVAIGQPRIIVREGEAATLRHDTGPLEIQAVLTSGTLAELTPPVPPPPAPPEPPAPPLAPAAIPPTPPVPPVPPVAPPPPAAPEIPVTQSVTPRLPAPQYPAAAVEQRLSGLVVLVIDIDANGRPTKVEVEHSEPAGVFDQAAADAARQWRFNPAVENGRQVSSRIRVPVEFRIPPATDASPGAKEGIDLMALMRSGAVHQAGCTNVVGHVGSDSLICGE